MAAPEMLKLAFSSYAYLEGHDPDEGRRAVAGALELFGVPRSLGWLAVTRDRRGASFSLAFVALSSREGVTEYDVVVRGTNPLSVETWIREDFNVGSLVPWPGSPGGGKVSQGTATALVLHEALTDRGEDLYSFLWDRITADAAAGNRSVVNFTGHSLGGLVAPVLALRFSETYPRFETLELNVFSFAAPTAGDRTFAAYLERSFTGRTRQNFGTIRFYRCREDVAVRVWDHRDMAGLARIYAPFGVPNNLFLVSLFRNLRKKVKAMGYVQPFRGQVDGLVPGGTTDAETFLTGDLLARFRRARALARRQTGPRVFRHTLTWLVQAVVMHVVPYADHLLEDRDRRTVADTVLRAILTHETFPDGLQI